MRHKLGELVAALAAVGSLPGASAYHSELKDIIEILAETALAAARLKKAGFTSREAAKHLGDVPE